MRHVPASLYAVGFPRWKRPIVRDFLPDSRVQFVRRPEDAPIDATLLVWGQVYRDEQRPVIRMEDAFLRSVGLGADLVRPLSLVLDRRGVHYDATAPSDLEHLLQTTDFTAELIVRAQRLRERIVSEGLSKYNVGRGNWQRPAGNVRVILVPGQVEQDASIRYGAPAIQTNIGLLQAVRAANPSAYVVYKPHPDVLAGLRPKGQDESGALRWSDEIVTDVSMGALLPLVDEVQGLPSWLLKDPNMQVRCAYPPYLAAVDRFFDALLPQLVPLQSTHGGRIIAMQVENEYGSYGNDKVYLHHLADGMRARGIDSILFTSDGPRDNCLPGGTLPDVFKTVNLAFNAKEAFAKLREYQPEGPLMVMEFWSGWFDHWGDTHHVSEDGGDSIQRSVDTLDEILALGASVNFYMFHGGTNFGFMNGSNCDPTPYQAVVTSYDYACPLSEWGDLSPRYEGFREVLRKYTELPSTAQIQPAAKRAFGSVRLTESIGLFESLEVLSHPILSLTPQPMEMYDQDYGFILYRIHMSGPRPKSVFQARQVHDRAQLFLNGNIHSILERETGSEYASFEIPSDGLIVDLLVENMGRTNFGALLLDRKGLIAGATFADQFQFGWEVFPLPLNDLCSLKFGAAQTGIFPGFFRATFHVDNPADTFLALPGWTKGVVWLNNFNLGRYWERGPQQTLYIPARY